MRREALTCAQEVWGVSFPPAYVALIEVRNGGSLRPELEPEVLGVGRKPHESIEGQTWDDLRAWLGPGLAGPRRHALLVPFAGDGHTWYCFDYRRKNLRREPTITYIDLANGEESRVSWSFESFLVRHVLRPRRRREKRERKRPPLHRALTRAEVERLVAEGADVDARDGEGRTALMHACFEHRSEVALALLGHGADPTKRHTELLMTALDYAHHASVEVLERMLAVGQFDLHEDLSLCMDNYKLSNDEERIRVLERHTGIPREQFPRFAQPLFRKHPDR